MPVGSINGVNSALPIDFIHNFQERVADGEEFIFHGSLSFFLQARKIRRQPPKGQKPTNLTAFPGGGGFQRRGVLLDRSSVRYIYI